jgi:sulfite reductase (NADPH) hemoprotein beta-component
MNTLYRENIGESQILELLRAVLARFAKERSEVESFGDFVVRSNLVPAMLHGKDFQRVVPQLG